MGICCTTGAVEVLYAYHHLVSYPGSLEVDEKGPGAHCLFMHIIMAHIQVVHPRGMYDDMHNAVCVAVRLTTTFM